jgi:K+-sensing histidine kinase KdpD
MIIIRDISELLKTEQAQTIQKVAECMIATTSHDMRTPLNTIISMHQMIDKKIRETCRYDETLENWMGIAQNSARYL